MPLLKYHYFTMRLCWNRRNKQHPSSEIEAMLVYSRMNFRRPIECGMINERNIRHSSLSSVNVRVYGILEKYDVSARLIALIIEMLLSRHTKWKAMIYRSVMHYNMLSYRMREPISQLINGTLNRLIKTSQRQFRYEMNKAHENDEVVFIDIKACNCDIIVIFYARIVKPKLPRCVCSSHETSWASKSSPTSGWCYIIVSRKALVDESDHQPAPDSVIGDLKYQMLGNRAPLTRNAPCSRQERRGDVSQAKIIEKRRASANHSELEIIDISALKYRAKYQCPESVNAMYKASCHNTIFRWWHIITRRWHLTATSVNNATAA